MLYNIITVYLSNYYFLLETQQNYMSVDLSQIFVVGVSTRALFNLEVENDIFSIDLKIRTLLN
jgi:hypothetical protein